MRLFAVRGAACTPSVFILCKARPHGLDDCFGLDVIEGTDLDVHAMDGKIIEFEQRIENADVAISCYACHGLQVDGENYPVPVDAQLANELQLKRQPHKLHKAI